MRNPKRGIGMKGVELISISVLVVIIRTSYAAGLLSDPGLLSKPSSNLILSLADPFSHPDVKSALSSPFTSRDAKATSVVQSLQSVSAVSQAPVLAALAPFNVLTESMWISNQIFIKNASPLVINALMSIPGIKGIAEDLLIPLLPVFNPIIGTPPDGPEWNVKKIKAPEIWNETKGEGVVVAGIDTGVRHTHESIADNYVGTENNGWYDPILFLSEPSDLQGHGTHTIATVVGKNGVGVAPAAKWMACRGCAVTGCLQSSLLACGQFVLCPSGHKSGQTQNCSNVPHIATNSWGGGQAATFYKPVVQAWKAAGIIPIFAIGNEGPKCESAGSPGDLEDVISVGSTNIDDNLSKFSSRGPKSSNETAPSTDLLPSLFPIPLPIFKGKRLATTIVKPEICAPGENVNSAHMLADNSYKILSGTSMATPATAGAAALLMSKNKKLTYAEMIDLLYTTTEQQLGSFDGEKCGNIPEDQWPNNLFGHGRLNVQKAYQKLLQKMKENN